MDDKKGFDIHLDAGENPAITPALKRTKGKIGFQANNGIVRFRKIEIKELLAKSEMPAAANAEPAKSPPRGGESALPPEAKAAAKAFEKASADARKAARRVRHGPGSIGEYQGID